MAANAPQSAAMPCGDPSPLMIPIPAGWFRMGCDTGRDDEKPVHRVWVDAFEMAAFQVTRAEYARFMVATGRAALPYWSDPAFQQARQPVVAPSWHDAQAYCAWLGGIHNRPYRLPTEAEWEWAARGGIEDALYTWGDAPPEALPDYAARCAAFWKTGPEPVGLYPANGYGLFNMGDNVHEWCADWYDARYYGSCPERNPQGPQHAVRRASRGGSWRHHIKISRCAGRSSIPPDFHYADYGFRVAC